MKENSEDIQLMKMELAKPDWKIIELGAEINKDIQQTYRNNEKLEELI